MNNIALKLQKCLTYKIAFKIMSKMHESNQISFTVSLLHFQRTHLQSLPSTNFGLSFMISSVAPT